MQPCLYTKNHYTDIDKYCIDDIIYSLALSTTYYRRNINDLCNTS